MCNRCNAIERNEKDIIMFHVDVYYVHSFLNDQVTQLLIDFVVRFHH